MTQTQAPTVLVNTRHGAVRVEFTGDNKATVRPAAVQSYFVARNGDALSGNFVIEFDALADDGAGRFSLVAPLQFDSSIGYRTLRRPQSGRYLRADLARRVLEAIVADLNLSNKMNAARVDEGNTYAAEVEVRRAEERLRIREEQRIGALTQAIQAKGYRANEIARKIAALEAEAAQLDDTVTAAMHHYDLITADCRAAVETARQGLVKVELVATGVPTDWAAMFTGNLSFA